MTPREITEEDRAEPERDKWVQVQLGKPHPLRTGRYKMSCSPHLHEGCLTKDWSMIRLARNMSNVCRNIRKEFSMAFWSRVEIVCPEEGDFLNLPDVLNDRPMACRGIKCLNFDVNLKYCDKEELDRFFDIITEKLDLESLTLNLTVEDRELKDMIDSQGNCLWLQKVKLVKVVSNFELNLNRGRSTLEELSTAMNLPSDSFSCQTPLRIVRPDLPKTAVGEHVTSHETLSIQIRFWFGF